MSKTELIVPNIFSGYPEIHAGMSTRQGFGNGGGVSFRERPGNTPSEMAQKQFLFFSALGLSGSSPAIPVQEHTTIVRRVDAGGMYESCDGLITNRNDVALTVTTADCVPIVLYDPIAACIAVIHAGWHGPAGKIVINTVNLMMKEYQSKPANILAYIGPSAGPCCYEVGHEVAVKFGKNVVNYGKIFLDLKEENEYQLLEQGLVKDHIETSEHCTICEENLFYSYRREGRTAGRMTAAVCMTANHETER